MKHVLMSQLAESQAPPVWDGIILQAGLGCAWRVFAASVLLSRATRAQAETSLRAMLSMWPSRQALQSAEYDDLVACCRPCGLQHRRASLLRRASRVWEQAKTLDKVPGAGPYVTDAVGLVCLGRTDLESNDHALVKYRSWLHDGGLTKAGRTA